MTDGTFLLNPSTAQTEANLAWGDIINPDEIRTETPNNKAISVVGAAAIILMGSLYGAPIIEDVNISSTDFIQEVNNNENIQCKSGWMALAYRVLPYCRNHTKEEESQIEMLEKKIFKREKIDF